MNEKKRILLFADWYEPGYKAGGPIRSCVNFVQHMQEDCEVFVFTSDRDLGATEPYPGIRCNEWVKVGKANIYYGSPGALGWKNIKRQWRAISPEMVYLNSMFSTRFTILPLLVGRMRGLSKDGRKADEQGGRQVGRREGMRVLLSPRGMLRASAIRFKRGKKKLFLRAFRGLGFHKRVHFLASDETELKDVLHYFGEDVRVDLVPNFPAALPADFSILEKKEGELSIIFIGRIHPIKNLDFLLRLLGEVRGVVLRLSIVGSLEDEGFWRECEAIIREFPSNIRVEYLGEMPNHELPEVIARHHIFALPTRGENFGHAIFEALSLGKPVLISDQTPWRGLVAAGAGWDLALDEPGLFRRAIEEAAAMGTEEYAGRCRMTRTFVANYLAGLDLKEEYLKLFC